MQLWYIKDLPTSRKLIVNALTGYCLSSPEHNDRSAKAIPCASGDEKQQWLPERHGNTFLLIDNHGQCLEVRGQSRADGAKIEVDTCNGASNQLWSIDSLRQSDYETLYQADKRRFSWVANPPDPLYPYPVEVENGRQICRAESTGWLGVVLGEECVGKTYEQVQFSTTEYESLFQSP
jgi:hypothetical protein